jgi:hypothetical protein
VGNVLKSMKATYAISMLACRCCNKEQALDKK